MTPHPIRHARSKGISFGTATALDSCTTQYSAWEDMAEKWWIGRPPSDSREVPSRRKPFGWVRVKTSQRIGWPRSQEKQWPQEGFQEHTT